MNLTIAAENGMTRWAHDLESQHTRRQDAQARAEADFAYEFVKAIEAGDPHLTPEWAGYVPDYEAGRALGMNYGDKGFPRRQYTLAECLQDSLDYNKGPSLVDVVKVLSLAMACPDPIVSLAARQLVQRAAEKYAEHNCPEVA